MDSTLTQLSSYSQFKESNPALRELSSFQEAIRDDEVFLENHQNVFYVASLMSQAGFMQNESSKSFQFVLTSMQLALKESINIINESRYIFYQVQMFLQINLREITDLILLGDYCTLSCIGQRTDSLYLSISTKSQSLLQKISVIYDQIQGANLHKAVQEYEQYLFGLDNQNISPEENSEVLISKQSCSDKLLAQEERVRDLETNISSLKEEAKMNQKKIEDVSKSAERIQSQIESLKMENQTELSRVNHQSCLYYQLAIKRYEQASSQLSQLVIKNVSEGQLKAAEFFIELFEQLKQTISPKLFQFEKKLEELLRESEQNLQSKKIQSSNCDMLMNEMRLRQLEFAIKEQQLAITLENEKQVLDEIQESRLSINPSIHIKKQEGQACLINQGILQESFLRQHFIEVQQCTTMERRMISALKQIESNIQNIQGIIINFKAEINEFTQRMQTPRELNIHELQVQFKQLLEISEEIDPVSLQIIILGKKIEAQVNGLKDPQYFKENILGPLFTQEMLLTIKKLVYVKEKGSKQKAMTFDDFSEQLFFGLYGMIDDKFSKKAQEIEKSKKKILRIESQLMNAEEKKTLNVEQNKGNGDDEEMESQEDAMTEKGKFLQERELQNARQSNILLEQKINWLQQKLEEANNSLSNDQIEYAEAKENLRNAFEEELSLIKSVQRRFRNAVDELYYFHKNSLAEKGLKKIMEEIQFNISLLLTKQERRMHN